MAMRSPGLRSRPHLRTDARRHARRLLTGSLVLALLLAAGSSAAQPVDSAAPPVRSVGELERMPPTDPSLGQPLFPPPVVMQPLEEPAAPVPAPVRMRPRYPRLGIGLRASGLWADDALLNQGAGGIGLELLLRIHARLTLELSAQYQRCQSVYLDFRAAERSDAPLLAGLRVHVGPSSSAASPYLVAALGADYARVAATTGIEAAWLAEWQGGIGLEGRYREHYVFSADVRGFGRMAPQPVLLVSEETIQPWIQNTYGILFNVGFAIYP